MTDKKPMNEQKRYIMFKRWNQEAFKFYDRAAQYACLMEQSNEKFKQLRKDYKNKLIKMNLYDWKCEVEKKDSSLKEFNDDYNKYFQALSFLYGSRDGYFDFIESDRLLKKTTIHEAFDACRDDMSPLKFKYHLENGPISEEDEPSHEKSNETFSFE